MLVFPPVIFFHAVFHIPFEHGSGMFIMSNLSSTMVLENNSYK